MSVFLKKEFDGAGYKTKVVHEHVLFIEDFLQEEELQTLLEIIKTTPNEDWSIEYTKNLARFCMEKFGRDDVDNLVAEGKFEITQGWEDKNLDITHKEISRILQTRLGDLISLSDDTLELAGFGTLQRMQPGVELKAHTDQHTDP